jgi:hypothetical protein
VASNSDGIILLYFTLIRHAQGEIVLVRLRSSAKFQWVTPEAAAPACQALPSTWRLARAAGIASVLDWAVPLLPIAIEPGGR